MAQRFDYTQDPSRGWPGLPVAGIGKPIEVPKVLKPLQYCEFRPGPEQWCAVFACCEVEGLMFCYQHQVAVKSALDAEGE